MFKVNKWSWAVSGAKNLTNAAAPPTRSVPVQQI